MTHLAPTRKRFELVTYCAPAAAFEDDCDVTAEHGVVTFSGPYLGSHFEPDGTQRFRYGPVETGRIYRPDDCLMDLAVELRMANATRTTPVLVKTFGRLIELHVSDGDQVTPGIPLFTFDARAPTTDEWRSRERARFEAEWDHKDLLANVHTFRDYVRWRRRGRKALPS